MTTKHTGRPSKVTDELRAKIVAMHRQEGWGLSLLAEASGLSERTVRRVLATAKAPPGKTPTSPAPRPVATDTPATLRGRLKRLEAALEAARERVSLESPIGARLATDLVNVRLTRARVDTRQSDVLTYTRDEIDEARRSLVAKLNASLATGTFECESCRQPMRVEPIPTPAPIWRPETSRVGRATEMREDAAELSVEVDELISTAERIEDQSVAAKHLRQSGRLLNLLARIERECGVGPDVVAFGAAELAAVDEKRAVLAKLRDRPLLCAACSRKLSAAYGHTQPDGTQNES